MLAVLGNFEAYDRVRDIVARTFIERAGSNMDLESGMTVTIGAAGVKLDMRGTHANIARHVRRTASALDRDSPVHAPTSQKGAYRDLDDAKEKDDEKHMIGQNVGANKNQGSAKMSVRNLRIREDTAKYLLNLDVNSAFYDPKTRSMRNNPLAGTTARL